MRIEAERLTYIYGPGLPWEKRALDDLSLRIEEGEFVGLVGETGSGKSTLVQLLNGILRPTSGRVLLDGVDLTDRRKPVWKARLQVGLVFQFPESQLFAETVAEDIAFGPRNLGLDRQEVSKRVEESLLKVGLEPALFRQRSPFTLSGGEKRLVAIAGILAMCPRVLIVDEVTAGLDPRGKRDILTRIKLLHRNERTTVIMVSHDMDEIASLVERVVVLKGGRICRQGQTTEVFSDEESLAGCGIRLPTIPQILSSLGRAGWRLPVSIFDVQEAARLIAQECHRGAV
ncbi:MAG: energy-coupling factor transporter ATPase [Coprothermobacterota bacterium]|nr:energy-coupling factor transporter ATPase [Coprothermobacterota bacterium]